VIVTLSLSLFAGIMSWSFAEYALHNWVGHLAKGKNEFSREHLRHHAQKDYFAPGLKKWLLALPVLGLAGLVSFGIGGPLIGLSYTLGFGLTWLGYETLHYKLHKVAPRGPISRFLRRHHFSHHFQNPRFNHGVTSPIWDLAFGTWKPVIGVLQVPPNHAMDWLIDEQGQLKTEYAQDYALRIRNQAQPKLQPFSPIAISDSSFSKV
jgi:sterol desaturase/sphingolipid hydroxylase (fatty acid hydroxylase superfamily)